MQLTTCVCGWYGEHRYGELDAELGAQCFPKVTKELEDVVGDDGLGYTMESQDFVTKQCRSM